MTCAAMAMGSNSTRASRARFRRGARPASSSPAWADYASSLHLCEGSEGYLILGYSNCLAPKHIFRQKNQFLNQVNITNIFHGRKNAMFWQKITALKCVYRKCIFLLAMRFQAKKKQSLKTFEKNTRKFEICPNVCIV